MLREHAPIVRKHLRDWWDACREEPRLFWQTQAVRYAVYATGGFTVLWLLTYSVGLVVPPPPASARPEATTADYHVLCVNPDCGRHFVINRTFGFSGFPVDCAKCEQRTGLRGVRCMSKTCGRRWVAPIEEDGVRMCPECDGPIR